MGMNTPQNFSGAVSGGGGVRYAVARCVSKAGGCARRCVREGEKAVWLNRGRSGEGERVCRISVDGPGGGLEYAQRGGGGGARTGSGAYEGH